MKRIIICAFAVLSFGLAVTSCEKNNGTDKTGYELKADKTSVQKDETVTFTVTDLATGTDVTSKSSICIVNSACISGNTWTATDPGEYEFEAHYIGDGSEYVAANNTVKITVNE